eukprot:6206850-Pleurochrysis_carterae.AAC.1
MAIIDELPKARSSASNWSWAVEGLRGRSLRSSSTNAGARVAALIATSLMRGWSFPVESSCREDVETCCVACVSAKRA